MRSNFSKLNHQKIVKNRSNIGSKLGQAWLKIPQVPKCSKIQPKLCYQKTVQIHLKYSQNIDFEVKGPKEVQNGKKDQKIEHLKLHAAARFLDTLDLLFHITQQVK